MKNAKTSHDPLWLAAGIDQAAQIVVSKGFLSTYQTMQMQKHKDDVKSLSGIMSQLGAALGDKDLMGSELQIRRNMQAVDEMLTVTPEQWAQGFQSISRKRKALELFESAIAIARPRLAASPAELRDTLPDKPDFPAECSAAYRRTREHLIAHPDSPRWLALLLFTLARSIGSNTRAAFNADQWNDGTMFWFHLEQAWLQAEGVQVGRLLLDADKKFFSNKVAANLGTDMPQRLAETSSIAPSWSMFHPPW